MTTIRFGILGCANIAERYMIDAINAVKGCEVQAVASRDENKAISIAEKFNIQTVQSYDDLIANSNIDAIYIPLPIGMHKEWCLKAAKAKKHIICEKSLSDSFENTQEIINAFKENNVLIFENFMCDYHPQHQVVMDLIAKGEIGEIRYVEAKFGFPPLPEGNIRYSKKLKGGALNDAGAYTLFMARKLLQSEPRAVTAKLHNNGYDVDTFGTAMLEFTDNIEASIHFGFSHDYHNEYKIWGSKGAIIVSRAFSIPPNLEPPITLRKNGQDTPIKAPASNHFILLVEDFLKQLKDEKFNYDKILNQAKIMQAVRESSDKNQKIAKL